jgi:hypothetical protein
MDDDETDFRAFVTTRWPSLVATAYLITTSHAERLANLRVLLECIRFLGDPEGPLAICPRAQLSPWLTRFPAARRARAPPTPAPPRCNRIN